MNKNNKKIKKGLKSMLALLLGCFCLVATVPISASALETKETLEVKSKTNSVDELYERLMSCESYDQLSAVMENLTNEEHAFMAQFTDEQNTALEARVNELNEYSVNTLESSYEEIDPDAAFLWITKTFIGINNIPKDFLISVGDNQYMTEQAEKSIDSNGRIVLKWQIPVTASVGYQLKEKGAEIDDYILTAEPSGILTEDGVSVAVDASRVTMTWKKDINECSNKVFSLLQDHVFIIAAKSNVIVLSAAPLGATARTAITEEIKTFSGDFKHNNGNTVFFYQISQYLGKTITIDDTKVTVSADGATATIGDTKQWTKVKEYQYGYEAAQSDINITNTYRPEVCDLTIRKTVNGNLGDRNKAFPFTALLSGEGYSFSDVAYSIDSGESQSVNTTGNSFSFTLKHSQSITFYGLPVGATLKITENIDDNEYITTIDGEPGISKIITLSETNDNIVFDNRKDVTINTGIFNSPLPYIVSLGVVAIAIILLFKRRRICNEY